MAYSIDLDSKSIEFGGYSLSLVGFSGTEIAILEELAKMYPDAVSRERLLECGWPNKVVSDTSLNVAINSIRKNIQHQIDVIDEIILTERGFGYRLSSAIYNQTSTNTSFEKNDGLFDNKSSVIESTKLNKINLMCHIPVKYKRTSLLYMFVNAILLLVNLYILVLYLEVCQL
ncbi:winged helix-turn-helix domain-containing protein [Aeromonas enteropelogenes]|uniref:winged helix-turn-helix domain-containing protein n=1 Tax=Aeromonas enteropelogenes TaxID=29489 RepID=UPI003134863C